MAELERLGRRSSYRRHYWRFCLAIRRRVRSSPQKLWLGFSLLISAHHFIGSAAEACDQLDAQLASLTASPAPEVAASVGA